MTVSSSGLAPNYQALFEAAPGPYLVLSPELRIVAVNDAYLRATMTVREAIVGQLLFDVFPDNPDDPAATGVSNLRSSLMRVLEGRIPDVMAVQKYDVRDEHGMFEERFWSPINIPVLGENRQVIAIIHHVVDVTQMVKMKQEGIEQHKVTESLRSKNSQLEALRQSQRMEAMGQLAGGVAHDFNNFLGVIFLNCDHLLEEEVLSESARSLITQIQRAGTRAAGLTRQLLAFSRKQVLQPRVININGVVGDLTKMLERLLTEDIQLETKLASDLGNVLCDPGQVEQIILNLVVNARDAMTGGGKLTIETSNAFLDKAMAHGSHSVESGEYIMIAIRDSGVGMDAKTKARIFEPFFTTKPMGKGTGLGLATVYGIVTQNRGTIWVYSELQKGTVFKVYLPMVKDKVEFVPLKEIKPGSLRGTETILVVEDEPELRELICASLRRHGYTVIEAANGSDALTIASKRNSHFDLVITDVVMPEIGGRALAQKLANLHPDLRILFLSGYSEETLSNYGISGTEPYFLEKPFSQNTLLTKVRSVFAINSTSASV